MSTAAAARSLRSAGIRLRRRATCSRRSARTAATRSSRSARSTGTSLGWHRGFIVDLRGGDREVAFLAFAWVNDFAALAALLKSLKTVQAQSTFLLFFAVAAKARTFKHRPNVFGVGQAFLSEAGGSLLTSILLKSNFSTATAEIVTTDISRRQRFFMCLKVF